MAENNTDEFGEFVETKSGDEFGDFVSTEKKNASLPDSTTPVSQGSEPSVQSFDFGELAPVEEKVKTTKPEFTAPTTQQDILKGKPAPVDFESDVEKIKKLRNKQIESKLAYEKASKEGNSEAALKATIESDNYKKQADEVADNYAKQHGYNGTKLGLFDTFINSMNNTVEGMDFGMKYMQSNPEQRAKLLKDRYEKNQAIGLQPKEGALGTVVEVAGGLAPFIGVGVATGGFGELPALIAGAGSFGLAEIGAKADEGYAKAKEEGLSDEEAESIAHEKAAFGAGEGVLLGGALHGIGGKELPKTFMDWLGKAAKKNATIGSLFSGSQLAENMFDKYRGREVGLTDNVIQKGIEGFTIGILTDGLHKMGESFSLPEKKMIQDVIAYTNPDAAIIGLNKAADAGLMTRAEANNIIMPIAEKAKVFNQLPEVPFEKATEVAPHVEKIDKLNKDLENASPALKPDIERQIKEENMQVKEKLSTPLTDEEKVAHFELGEKSREGKLNPIEKRDLEHYQTRIDKIKEEKKAEKEAEAETPTNVGVEEGSGGVGADVKLGNNTIIADMSLPFDSGVNTGLVKNSKGAVYHDKNTAKFEKLGYSKEQIDKLSQVELDEILAKNIENPNVETSAKMPLAEKQTTTQEFLNEADKEGGRFSELAKALKQFFGIDGVETEIVKGLKDFFGKNNDGDYANNKIRIDEKAKNKLQTFLHEAIHKVTVDKILQFERGDYSKLSKQDIEAIQNLTRIFNESKVKIHEFLGGGKGDRTKGHYGFTNVHEFISEAFTNPEFQSLLRNLPTEGKNPTIFKQFLDAVAKFLGLKDASILNDIFYHTENLREQSIKETTKAESNVEEGSGGVGGDGKKITITGYRNKGSKDVGENGTFYTQSEQDRPTNKKEISFDNALVLTDEQVEQFEGLPNEYLAYEWFPDVDFTKEAKRQGISESGHLMDKMVTEEAIKRGYDGIVYGTNEIVDLRTHPKAVEQPLKETPKAETTTTTSNVGVEEGSVGVGGDVGATTKALEEEVKPVEEKIPDTDLTHSEAVKFLDDHAVQDKIDTYGIRPDFRMSSEELERGMKQIREGKLEMVAAKNMLAKIAEWKAQGYVDLIHLKGGTTVRLSAPYEIAEALAKLDEVETKMVAEVHEKVDEVVDQISDEDAQIEVDKILSNFTDANGDIDFIKLKEEYNGFNANILELSSKADEILKAKIDESGTTKENATEGSPTVNTKGAGSEEGDYKTVTEEVEMPDGEAGLKVTIEKPNGEKVELGNMYPEDVEREVAKKIRGFKLSETKPTEKAEEVKSELSTKEVGEEISFTHAGGNVKGKIVSVENGKYKVKGSDGLNYTVAVENARTPETVEQAKKSIAENMKKLQDLSKPKDTKKAPAPKLNALVPKDVVTAPFKLLGMGDKLIAHVTSKMEDGIAKSFRRGMANSNKYLSRGSSEVQGIFKQLALTEKDIEDRRKGLGQMSAAPLKAVKFYQSGVDIVGKTPESLQNVHQVLDPEVYAKRGLPTKAEADLSPTEKQLYDLLRSTNDMIHDWHYVNGRISEDVYLKNKGTYAPRFYDNIEFADLPNDLKASFEDFSKQQNFSYIKERKNFEDVMAENSVTEDPVYGTSMRLGQMLRNQAIMDYAAVVAAKTKTYSEGDTDIPNSYIKLEGGGKFGNINTYGDLTNKYVPRDIAEDFKGATFINQAMDNVYNALKWYNRRDIRKLLNKTKTIYNPITQLGNIGSNYVFAMMNGIDPLTYQHRKFEAAKIVKEQGDLYLKLVEEGILGTDITTKDLKLEAKGVKKEKGVLGKIDEKITEFYSTRDDIAKVAAYLAHTKDYGRSEIDALKRVSEGFQNYNNVGRFYDFASKTPVIGNPFVKFKGDLMRIMKNNFSQRPLTNIAMLAGLNVIASAFSNWSGEDEDVKKAREMRSFIPKVPLPNALGGDIPLVWQTPYGEINAARYFSPFNIYDMGDKGSTVEEVTQFLPYQATPEKPFTKFPDPFLGAYFQVAFDKDFRGKPILDPEANKWREGNADFEEKIQNAATFIARQQIPFYAGADDMLRAYNGEPDYYGRNKDLKQALFSNLIKVEQKGKPEVIADIKKDIDFKLSALDKLNKEVYDAKKLASKNISKINSSTSTNKQVLILKEQRRASNKIAEIMDEQAEIKRKLIEPRKMLEKIK